MILMTSKKKKLKNERENKREQNERKGHVETFASIER